jgi:hypothetical protein
MKKITMFLFCSVLLVFAAACVDEFEEEVDSSPSVLSAPIYDGTSATDETSDYKPSVMLTRLSGSTCGGVIVGRGMILTNNYCTGGDGQIISIAVTGVHNGAQYCLTDSGGASAGACEGSDHMDFLATHRTGNYALSMVLLQLVESQGGTTVTDFGFPSGTSAASWRTRISRDVQPAGEEVSVYGWGHSSHTGGSWGGGSGHKRVDDFIASAPVSGHDSFTILNTANTKICRGDQGAPAVATATATTGNYDKLRGVVGDPAIPPDGPGSDTFCSRTLVGSWVFDVESRLTWLLNAMSQDYAPFSAGPKVASVASCSAYTDSDGERYYKCW